MKILVTGVAGFIGSHVADAFLADGHAVYGIDDLSSGVVENVPSGVSLDVVDIRHERASALIQRIRPDILVHHAGQIDVRASVARPDVDADINVVGSLRLFEASVAAGCRRVIFASTGGAIYGEQSTFPADERHPTDPTSPYGVSKLAVEHYLRTYVGQRGIRAACLRYANVYGPRQNPHGEAGVIAIFLERLCRGKAVVINGDGEQTRDFVFVEDVARANILAASANLNGAYNVGTGIETSINELYAQLRAIVSTPDRATHKADSPGEQKRSSISAAKLEADTKWRPSFSLRRGLEATYAWFSARGTREIH